MKLKIRITDNENGFGWRVKAARHVAYGTADTVRAAGDKALRVAVALQGARDRGITTTDMPTITRYSGNVYTWTVDTITGVSRSREEALAASLAVAEIITK